ncbi:DUF1771-domain-containing protein [Xylaria sp. FL1777]|nr:DUF1771-domain-containing protein [Xylaria sp. FL1777]
MSAGIELDRYERGYDRLGGQVFSSNDVHPDRVNEAKDTRESAWAEVDKQKSCMRRAHEAYERGDGATAKHLSNEGKRHAAEADILFSKASDIIFEQNNPEVRPPPDTIDLHGLYVADAVKRVEKRVREDQQKGKTHLHVIVGKGNHSVDHVQKIKPAIEELCQNLGLQYATEENEGRIYVNLQGEEVTHIPASPHHDQPHGQPHGQHQAHQQQQQQHYGDQQQHYAAQQGQHYGGQNQQEEQDDEIERLLTKLFKKYCCTVM